MLGIHICKREKKLKFYHLSRRFGQAGVLVLDKRLSTKQAATVVLFLCAPVKRGSGYPIGTSETLDVALLANQKAE